MFDYYSKTSGLPRMMKKSVLWSSVSDLWMNDEAFECGYRFRNGDSWPATNG